jgi:Mn2+/Fe2+ NRAMP family transporter
VVNAILLPLHVIALVLLANDPDLMGNAKSGKITNIGAWLSIGLILACVGALILSWVKS